VKFKKEKSRNYYLNETPIPNLFLGEYMLRMPGDVVRVYLYAYMRMMAGDPPADEAAIARELGIRTADVLDAWDYLEKKRLIRRRVTARDPGSYTIEFIDLKSRLFVAGGGPGKRAGGAGGKGCAPNVRAHRKVAWPASGRGGL